MQAMENDTRPGMGDIEIDGRMVFDQQAYYADNPWDGLEKMYFCAVAGRSVEDCPAVITEKDREFYVRLLAECDEIRRSGGVFEMLMTRLD